MLLNAPYPDDIRVRKESNALLKNGFEIYLLCLRKESEPKIEKFGGITIYRVDAGKKKYQLAFWDAIISVFNIHPKFLLKAKGIIKNEKIDFVHVHDLPLVGTAISLKKEFSIKVIADFHENYPEALRTWFKWKKNPLVRIKNRLFMNPDHWMRLEKFACKNSDHIIAVVEEMKERLILDHHVANENITVITNTEDRGFIDQKLDESVYQNLANKFIVTYSGGIGPHRGVDTAIKGMALLREYKEINLAIVGFGSPAVMSNLKSLVENLDLTSVKFFGYQPFSKFYSFMHFASVNVIPHKSNGHTNNTVPHKLFQGMMAAKPLLVSSSPPLKRIVEKHDSGLVFLADDEKDFALKVKELYMNKDLCNKLGQHGYECTINGEVNWENTGTELSLLYKKIS